MSSRSKKLLELALNVTEDETNRDHHHLSETSLTGVQQCVTTPTTTNGNHVSCEDSSPDSIHIPDSPSILCDSNNSYRNENLLDNPQPEPGTSGMQQRVASPIITTEDSDFSSDDSIADPTFMPSNTPDGIQEHSSVSAVEHTCVPALQHSRKRKQERKIKRNFGKAYVTASGKTVNQRCMKPLPPCRNKCRDKINEQQRQQIFENFWNLGSYDLRVQYVSSLMSINEKKTERKQRVEDPDKQRFRQVTYKYRFEINSENIHVCQGCFLKTLDVTDNFVKLIGMKRRSSSSGIVESDKRGTKPPPNKHTTDKIKEVADHINSFPLYESHYTRNKSSRKYLPSHLTISKMYLLYKESHENPVSDKVYRREFHKLNLNFKKPKVDTCHACDVFKMKIDLATDEAIKTTTLAERESHQKEADMAYAQKKKDKELAANHDSKMVCLTFDLQQCLPTPALETSVAFYKRQLWTFNLTIHNNANGTSTHFMWHEAISGRGANQVASCLFKYLLELPDHVTEIILFSDTCGGQNKNTHVAAMFTYLLQKKPTLKAIHHKFMVSGHSHMEVDLDHAIIEKKKKKSAIKIYHPHDWLQLVRSSSPKFTVVEMSQDNFLDFAALLKGPLVMRKKDNDGNVFKWQTVKWLHYTSDFGLIKYKMSLDEAEPFHEISFKRNTRQSEITLKKITDKPVAISVEKKRDLVSLLTLVPECFHNFYKNLKTAEDVRDVDPDLSDSDDSES